MLGPIEVGQKYLTKDGTVVTIDRISKWGSSSQGCKFAAAYSYKDKMQYCYGEGPNAGHGIINGPRYDWDLVSLIVEIQPQLDLF